MYVSIFFYFYVQLCIYLIVERTLHKMLFNSTEWKVLLSRRYACKTGRPSRSRVGLFLFLCACIIADELGLFPIFLYMVFLKKRKKNAKNPILKQKNWPNMETWL